jgi:hypothetical protein
MVLREDARRGDDRTGDDQSLVVSVDVEIHSFESSNSPQGYVSLLF